MQNEFNHAANEPPRSGASKATSPMIWGAIIAAGVATVLWLALHA
ncbi:hypothetical protein [Bradyrhizobium genosp. L]|nr:hypothetical protein [Bradyrhizobium genosp. L]